MKPIIIRDGPSKKVTSNFIIEISILKVFSPSHNHQCINAYMNVVLGKLENSSRKACL